MTHNLLLLGVEVSFQGENHAFQAELDLDAHLRQYGDLPDLHHWVASCNRVDAYSYLFEAMQVEPVSILQAHGRAAEFTADGQFLSEAFIADWRIQNALPGLVNIAQQQMQTDLETHPSLKQALIDAYQLGLEHGRLIPQQDD